MAIGPLHCDPMTIVSPPLKILISSKLEYFLSVQRPRPFILLRVHLLDFICMPESAISSKIDSPWIFLLPTHSLCFMDLVKLRSKVNDDRWFTKIAGIQHVFSLSKSLTSTIWKLLAQLGLNRSLWYSILTRSMMLVNFGPQTSTSDNFTFVLHNDSPPYISIHISKVRSDCGVQPLPSREFSLDSSLILVVDLPFPTRSMMWVDCGPWTSMSANFIFMLCNDSQPKEPSLSILQPHYSSWTLLALKGLRAWRSSSWT